MVDTEANFTVTGKTVYELETAAIKVIESLFGDRSGGVVFDMRIDPCFHEFGTVAPALWEARVFAREGARDDG